MKIGNYRLVNIKNEIHPELFTVKATKALLYMERVFQAIGKKDGAFVECGVGKGRTFAVLAILSALEGKERKIIGFDSFSGFPEPSYKDQSPRQAKKGDWHITSPEIIRKRLVASGISLEVQNGIVEIIPGFFEQTLSSWRAQPIALLHLDVDLYDSYKICLETLYPYVVSGGAVLFDEYIDSENKWPGAVLAIDEFFLSLPVAPKKDDASGKYYVIKP